jgi:hypothetical protein
MSKLQITYMLLSNLKEQVILVFYKVNFIKINKIYS